MSHDGGMAIADRAFWDRVQGRTLSVCSSQQGHRVQIALRPARHRTDRPACLGGQDLITVPWPCRCSLRSLASGAACRHGLPLLSGTQGHRLEQQTHRLPGLAAKETCRVMRSVVLSGPNC